jgi:DNA-binding MarR family transcriptional regulator
MAHIVKRPPPKPLTAGPGFVIRQAHKALTRHLAEALTKQGISFKHYYYLRALFEEDGISQAELSDRVGMEPATLTRVLDTMERDGLVRRERDAGDRRKINVYLTPRSKRLRDPLVATIDRINNAALDGISEREYNAFRGTLRRLVENLDRLPQDG